MSSGIRGRILLFAAVTCVNLPATAVSPPRHEEVSRVIRTVNDHWQETHPKHGDAFWNRAVDQIRNLHAHAVTGEPAYCAFSEAWAKHNDWKGAKSNQRSGWCYDYGETDPYLLFGD